MTDNAATKCQVQWTYCDILKIVAQLSGSGHCLTFCDPLLQLIHILFELIKPILLLQLGLSVLHHVLQRHIQAVYVGLLLGDLLAVDTERNPFYLLNFWHLKQSP